MKLLGRVKTLRAHVCEQVQYVTILSRHAILQIKPIEKFFTSYHFTLIININELAMVPSNEVWTRVVA
jgi:hypothetical protein